MKRTFAAVVLTVLATASAFAQHAVFHVDPAASQVDFTLGAVDHGTKGTFHVEKGTIDFDPKLPKLDGLIVVTSNSGKTGNDSRDKKMTNEVLDATHFDTITFAPKTYTGTVALTGDSTIQATGIFTLHGTPHEITVPIQIHIDGVTCTAHTTFPVPYVKWGLKDPSIFILKVAKEVQVDLKLTGDLAKQ